MEKREGEKELERLKSRSVGGGEGSEGVFARPLLGQPGGKHPCVFCSSRTGAGDSEMVEIHLESSHES